MTNVLSVDIGGTNLRVGIVDQDNHIHHHESREISGLPHLEVYAQMNEIIATKLEIAHQMDVKAVGLSLTGHVERRTGVAIHILPDGQRIETNVAGLVSEITGLPCVAINDGTTISLAEWRAGAAQGKNNVVSIHFGTYTASGIIANGQPLERRTSSPLLGAMLVEEPDGSIHSANLDFSGAGFEIILAKYIENHPDSELTKDYRPGLKAGEYIFHMAQKGNFDAQAIYKQAGIKLGIHIASIMNIFDPEVVTLGGRFMKAAQYFMPEVNEIINAHAIHSIDGDSGRASEKIKDARYSHDSGIVGAAIAARLIVEEPNTLA